MAEAPTAAPPATPFEPQVEGVLKPRLEDLGPVAAMGLMFLMTQLLAVFVAGPFQDAGIRAFEDKDDPSNPIIYFLLILAFTIAILVIAKLKLDWLIQLIILGAIGATLVYVFWPLLAYVIIDPLVHLGFSPLTASWIDMGISIALASILTYLLYKWPEWYIVDSVGILVAAGATAIFGVSFGFFPALILLVLLAAYDAIAVYRTRHMLALADTVMGLRLPIMLVVPKHRDYSFLEEKDRISETATTGKPREAMFMGLGDLVIPSVLIVVAYADLGNTLAAVGSLLGTFVGFLFLMSMVLKGKAHAGLPSLNGGSLLGFFIGYWLSGAAWGALEIPGIG